MSSSPSYAYRYRLPSASPPFSRLPLELVKQIVVEVHAQDTAFKAGELGREVGGADDDWEERRERWGGAYRRGVYCLSLVSRALRELTLPYIFELSLKRFVFSLTVSASSLEEDCFRYQLLGSQACSYITTVDLSGFNHIINEIAWALPQLPRLKSIAISSHLTLPLVRPTPLNLSQEWETLPYAQQAIKRDEVCRREWARCAFHRALGRIVELKLTSVHITALATTLKCAALPHTLERLALQSYFPLFQDYRSDLADALEAFRLSSLRLDVTDVQVIDQGWNTLRLTHLTSLDMPAIGFGLDTLYILSVVAPNLTHLSLTSSDGSTEPHRIPIILSRLRVLRVSGPSHNILSSILPHSSTIRLLDVNLLHHRKLRFRMTVHSLLPFAMNNVPSTLQHLRIPIKSQFRPSTETLVRDELASHGIYLDLNWRPMALVEPDEDEGEEAEREQAARVVEEDLRWGAEAARAMERTGDTAGLREMAGLLRRLRERRMVEEQ